MTMLQALAASMAGVDRVDLYTVSPDCAGPAGDAVRVLRGEWPDGRDAVIGRIARMGVNGGIGDGD